MSLITELKRRNVFRMALLYLVSSWLILQVADVLAGLLSLPEWTLRLVGFILLLGFPLALIFSWVYELTPEGLKREKDVDRSQSIADQTGRKLNVTIVLLLVAAVGLLLSQAVREGWTGPVNLAPPDLARQEPARPADSPTPAAPAVYPPTAPRQSIAVLPFTTRSPDPDDVFFTDGIHDDLLTQLAKIGALKVISRTSVMEYRETTKKIPEIAAELNVAHLLEGAVQRAGDRVRINAQLIDAQTDEHIWAETFDRELSADNVFDIQSEIARRIAGALHTTLSADEVRELGRRLTDNLEAWRAYLRGMHLVENQREEDYSRAEEAARTALKLDPDFAAAYGLLARVHLSRYWFLGTDPIDLAAARLALETGRQIKPTSPELDIAEAYYHYWGRLAYDDALAALERALRVIPNDAELHKVKAYALRRAGRYAQSNAALELAHSLDPRDGLVLTTMMETYGAIGRFEAAKWWERIAVDLDTSSAYTPAIQAEVALARGGDWDRAIRLLGSAAQDNAWLAYYRWFAHVAADRLDEAVSVADFGEYAQSRHMLFPASMMLGVTQRLAANDDEAARLLAQAEENLSTLLDDQRLRHKAELALCYTNGALADQEATRNHCRAAVSNLVPDRFDRNRILVRIAEGYAMAGLIDEALATLESTLDDESRWRAAYLRVDPMLASLRDDPRFEPLLERIDRVEPVSDCSPEYAARPECQP